MRIQKGIQMEYKRNTKKKKEYNNKEIQMMFEMG
jgi:hypothetical protein